ncbi:MAG: ABC transporter ATP-binding protein [Deltaproteobacteria bacterium]
MPGIRLEQVSKVFPGGNQAVKDIMLEVKNEELLVLTGPSDCGKSTLLRLIAGLDELTSGEIYIDGQLANFTDPIERNIAVVYQNLTFYPYMNILGNIEFGLKFSQNKGRHIKENIKNICDLLQITDLLQKQPNQLDVFEKQRVAFAKAAVKSPKVFLVDRVCTDCDEDTKKGLYQEIVDIWNKLKKTTIVAIDSDMIPFDTVGRIAVMNNGGIEQIDTYTNLYNMPCNKFVAGFVGKGRTSFINARIGEENGRTGLKIGKNILSLRNDKIDIIKNNGYLGKEIIIALRPEDIKVGEKSSNNECMHLKVDAAETIKGETFLHLTADEISFFVKSTGKLICSKGEEITASVDINKILFFDKDTEKLI